MTLPSTGAIKFSDLESEYTESASNSNISFSEFYFGGSKLQSNSAAASAYGDSNHPKYSSHFENIPAAASPNPEIRMSWFRGKSAYYARQTTLERSGNVATVSGTDVENEFWKTGNAYSAFYDIVTNGECTSNNRNYAALRITPAPSRPGSTAHITTQHTVSGAGGKGGRGENGGSNGEPGFTALRVRGNAYLVNNSTLRGGGGGGGGGGSRKNSYNECYCCNETNGSISGSGGGGGAGHNNAPGGSRGNAPGANFQYNGGNGSPGSSTGGGSGGSGCAYNVVLGTYCSKEGGDGGNYGQKGEDGDGGTKGGESGKAIRISNGKYFVKLTTGTLQGGEDSI